MFWWGVLTGAVGLIVVVIIICLLLGWGLAGSEHHDYDG